MNNRSTIEQVYKAFAKGNVPAILEHISDDVEWDYASTTIDVPWLKRRSGKEGALEFFHAVGSLLEFEEFQPKEILEGENVVVALLDVSFKVRQNGANVRERDEIHVFRFNDGGKITSFRHGVDSYEHFRAFSNSVGTSRVSA